MTVLGADIARGSDEEKGRTGGLLQKWPSREDAWLLVTEHTRSNSLLRHMLAVEAAMRAYARHFGEDEDLWAIAGLVHDFDYERYPDCSITGHPVMGARILEERAWPAELCRAVLAHAAEYTGVAPLSLLERTLVAVDELTGFLAAVALVRPSRDIRDVVEVRSVRKKWKDRAFAAAVNREEIERACEALGVDLWARHVPLVLSAMQGIAGRLGLAGETS